MHKNVIKFYIMFQKQFRNRDTYRREHKLMLSHSVPLRGNNPVLYPPTKDRRSTNHEII